MKIFFISLVLIVLSMFCPFSVRADLLINEVSTFDRDDWVEIYNAGSHVIDLSNYELRDVTSSGGANRTKLFGSIASGEFVVFDVGNKINKDGDIVSLYLVSPSENLVDSISFGDKGGVCAPTSSDQTIGRIVDGKNTIERFANSTKGVSNTTASLFPCSTPTTKPTATEKPTNTPTNAPTNTPIITNTRTPSKTSAPVPSPPQTNDPSISLSPTNYISSPTSVVDNVRGVFFDEDKNDKFVDVNKSENEKHKDHNNSFNYLNVLPYLLIISGIAFIVTSLFLLAKKRKDQ
ncbi:MAG: lamin tail domain-containing protein [Patescibacteria group bacterium]|nr:lamin tail domain-containing protein [Patescibacteria group bacterium]